MGFKEDVIDDFSLSIGQDLYTPENIELEEVDSTYRPYAGLLYLTYSRYSNDFYRGRQIQTNFYFGLIGKYAFGKEVQNGIHNITNNKKVEGWDLD